MSRVFVAENDDMVQTCVAQCSDQSLRKRILQRSAGSGDDFLDAKRLHALSEILSEDAFAIADPEAGRCIVGESLDDLVGSPRDSRTFGHIDVTDVPVTVTNEDQDE